MQLDYLPENLKQQIQPINFIDYSHQLEKMDKKIIKITKKLSGEITEIGESNKQPRVI